MSEEYAKTLIGEVVEKLKEAEVKIEDIWEALLHHTKKIAAESVPNDASSEGESPPPVSASTADPNSAPEAPTVTPISVEPAAGVEPSTVEPALGNPA